jgi:integrase/recombinase XerD
MGTLSWTRGDGPLVPFAKGFCQELARRGHPPSTQKNHLKLMGQLNPWLFAEGLDVSCLTSERANDFFAWRRALGQRRVPTLASLAPLFHYLRAEHALSADEPEAVTPRNELLAHYRQHLVVERGLMTTTVTRYERSPRQQPCRSHAGSQ